jgi:hypothetical protein
MHLHHGKISEIARTVAMPGFAAASALRFAAVFGETPSESEVRSWERSWPVLLAALVKAGLSELSVLLEYSLPGTSERIDALVLGDAADGALTAVVMELKQWTSARTIQTMPGTVIVADRYTQHLARQVGGYVRYLQDWVSRPELPLHVEGLAILHDASAPLITELRQAAASGESAAYPLLGREYLAQSADELARALRCAGLQRATPERVEALLAAKHRPSSALLARAGEIIAGRDELTLIGNQDEARRHVLRAVAGSEQSGGKSVIVVTGGPGTGKTVIACRLLGDLCKRPGANPRLLSPSSTITKQLRRVIGDSSRGLVGTFLNNVPSTIDEGSVVLLDEAHRARTYRDAARGKFPLTLGKLIDRAAVTVLFLDERQIIRPSEGITLAELRGHAAQRNIPLIHVDLTTQFRCNGSNTYRRWIDELLEPRGAATPWNGNDYDLAVADDPHQFSHWVQRHTDSGETARIAAGFCWPWESPPEPPLLPEVEIIWTGQNGPVTWARPWNARQEELSDPDVPARQFWSTDPGGHNQVGCIYTAQGMEYAYNVVIIGNDLVRRGDRWVAQPHNSHDLAELASLSPDRYLPYALNTYRVLATRGMKGARLYSTDPETQSYLRTLLPSDRSQ